MNTRISFRVTLFVSLVILTVFCQTSNAQVPVILRQWAVIAGNSDSTFKSPIVSDEDYTYVATTSFETPTGFNILIVKYDKEGRQIWTQAWSGPGNGMDQPSDMAEGDSSLYICGITYTSSTNNYDFVTLRVDKGSGAIMWDTTFNGSASSYDVATAIAVNDDAVYITGTTNGTGTSLDYMTIKYNKTNGAEYWHEAFDYTALMDIPFDIEIKNDSNIVVTGGSQNSITDWDYQTIEYDDHGNVLVSTRASGSGAGFDRAQAAKSDAEGNIYVTGATVNNSNYDIETVKITAAGMVAWQYKKDFNAEDDLGNDLIVDGKGNVYVCGQTKNSGSNEFIVMKLDSTGHEQWSTRIGGDGRDYIATKMCFDSWGNIIATGSSPNPNDAGNTDFFTVGFDTDGNEIWRDNYDGADHGNDKASDITADANGNIFVTGQALINSEQQTVTIRYRTDYYTEPAQVDTPSATYLFYPNSGQIVNTLDSSTVDSVHYYTLHHYPQLYFGFGVMNMVWSHVDLDTATQDTMQRVDVSFLNSSNVTEAYPIDEQDSAGYLNYFLGQCPDGITNVYGNSKLLYTDVYPGINAMYTSNNAGLKLYFICAPNCDNPNQVGLLFQGQDSLSINQNWELEVHTALGNYVFEKPRVYLLDNNNNVTSLSWHLNWSLTTTDQAQFSGWGSYDASKTLVIELSRQVVQANFGCNGNLCWSTFYGGFLGSSGAGGGDESAGQITRDNNNCLYTAGTTASTIFPYVNNIIGYLSGITDALITKFRAGRGSMTNLIWVTYYGGNGWEDARGIDVIKSGGDIYFTGITNSPNIITKSTSSNFYYSLLNQNGSSGFDAYLVRLSNNGAIVRYATYIGGEQGDAGIAVAINQLDSSVYVGGMTASSNTLTYPFPFRTSSNTNSYNQQLFGGIGANYYGDGFIMKFDKNNNCPWSTYFGGDSDEYVTGIIITSSPKIIVTGNTTTLNATNPTPGSVCLANNSGLFPVCDPGGTARYFNRIFNSTSSRDFDCFLAAFNMNDQLVWSTYFGGAGNDYTQSVNPITTTYTPSNKYALIGTTNTSSSSPNTFPILTPTGSFNQSNSGNSDAFVAIFNNEFEETWCSCYGGNGNTSGWGAAFDSHDNLYITGETSTSSTTSCGSPSSSGLPICSPGNYYLDNQINGTTDGFIAGFDQNYSIDWSIYFGGNKLETGISLIVNGNNLFAYGNSNSKGIDFVSPHGYYNQWQPLGNNDTYLLMFDIPTAVGVDEIGPSDFNLSIIPNPATEYCEVRFSPNFELLQQNIKFEIYDLSGRCLIRSILEKNNQEFANKIRLSELSQGMYFVKISLNHGLIAAKFIKQ